MFSRAHYQSKTLTRTPTYPVSHTPHPNKSALRLQNFIQFSILAMSYHRKDHNTYQKQMLEPQKTLHLRPGLLLQLNLGVKVSEQFPIKHI